MAHLISPKAQNPQNPAALGFRVGAAMSAVPSHRLAIRFKV